MSTHNLGKTNEKIDVLQRLSNPKNLIFGDEKTFYSQKQLDDLLKGKTSIKLKTRVEFDSNGQILIFKERCPSGLTSGRNSGVWLKKQLSRKNITQEYETDFANYKDNLEDNFEKNICKSSSNYDEDGYYNLDDDEEEDDDIYYDLDDDNMYLEDEDLLYKRMMEDMEQEMQQEMFERMMEDQENDAAAYNNVIFNNLHQSIESQQGLNINKAAYQNKQSVNKDQNKNKINQYNQQQSQQGNQTGVQLFSKKLDQFRIKNNLDETRDGNSNSEKQLYQLQQNNEEEDDGWITDDEQDDKLDDDDGQYLFNIDKQLDQQENVKNIIQNKQFIQFPLQQQV